MSRARVTVAVLALSAAGLVGIAKFEGYEPVARSPLPGDVPTLGFGETQGVRAGDTTTPVRALIRLHESAGQYERGVQRCVAVPLHQHEYDSFVSFSYNLGVGAFCGADFVKRLNAGDYEGACSGMAFHPDGRPAWSYFQGRFVQGLHNRRLQERNQCLGL